MIDNKKSEVDELWKVQVQCLEDRYDIQDTIGSGSFAQVIRAKEKISGQMRAIKRIQINPLADQITEISHLKTLNCDHIIEFYGYILLEQSNELNIIMQLCKGSLRDQLNKNKYFGPEQVFDLIVQVTQAMLHLNDKFIMHLDLKPENILFQHDSYYKLCDFGCAQLFHNISKMASNQKAGQNRLLSSVGLQLQENTFGTPRYIAPQIQLNMQRIGKNSCDIWSLGIILYELIYKKHPFELDANGRVKDRIFKKFLQGEVKINFPATNQKYPIQLLKLMLQPHPMDRTTWRKLKQTLVKMYGRHEAQFLNVVQAARRQMKMSLIMAELTIIIQQNLEENDSRFWKNNRGLVMQFKQNLTRLGYSYLAKFYTLFEYKMKYKLSASMIASFDFMLENLEDEVFSGDNPEEFRNLDLTQIQSKFFSLISLLETKLKTNLAFTEVEKLYAFTQQVEKFRGETLFCGGHLFPVTCEKFGIQEQL